MFFAILNMMLALSGVDPQQWAILDTYYVLGSAITVMAMRSR